MFDFPLKFPGIDNNNPEEVLAYLKSHPEISQAYSNIDKWIAFLENYISYQKGKSSAQDLFGSIGEMGGQLSPETEKWLDNEIARENTEQQQNYELSARDTSLLSSGNQLQQLGLSPSSVIQVGGVSAGVQGSTADTAMRSNSALHQQEKINRYNNQMGLAKSLIGAAGQMASSGIYGAALGAVKNAGSRIAGAAAHSGLTALKAVSSSKEPRLPNNTNSMDSRLKKDSYYSLFY